MRSNIPDSEREECAYSSKVENFFSDNDDISTYEDDLFFFFLGSKVHMEDVGNKDDISTYEDDFFCV